MGTRQFRTWAVCRLLQNLLNSKLDKRLSSLSNYGADTLHDQLALSEMVQTRPTKQSQGLNTSPVMTD